MEIGEDGALGQIAQLLVDWGKRKATSFAMTLRLDMVEGYVQADRLTGIRISIDMYSS